MKSAEHGYLLDVNVLVALLTRAHIHHTIVTKWFTSLTEPWAICPFTEAGFLRVATSPRVTGLSLNEASAVLARVRLRPGYRFLQIKEDWHSLCSPFFPRLYGTNQVTDAYLLGLAVQNGMALTTLDKAITHLAGAAFAKHVLVLQTP